MNEDNYCKKCKVEMKVLEEKIISGTRYKVLKCEECKHQIARTDS